MSNKNTPIFVGLSKISEPEIIEKRGKHWISYGEDNDYFDYIIERYTKSPTNNSVINSIVQMIHGKGVDAGEQQAEFDKLFPFEEIKKWSFDLKGLGYYVMQIILSKDGEQIATTKHSPVQNWRSGKADDNGVIHTYYYSDNWDKADQPNYRPKSYPAYKKGNKAPVQIYVVRPYRPNCFYYPIVDYQAGLKYAHLEEEISNFHLNNVFNGLFPGLLINFNNGDPGAEQRKKMEKLISQKWGGSDNAGRWILSFNDDKDASATIETVQMPDLDKMFDYMSDECLEKIMLAHRVTSPALFGIKENVGLGNNAQELKTAFQLYENTVIMPYRDVEINSFEFILAENGIEIDEIKFKSLNPFPFTYMPDGTQTTINDDDDIIPSPPAQFHTHKKKDPTADDVDSWLKHLDDVGEVIDEDEWELVHEERVDDLETEELDDDEFFLEFSSSKGELKGYSDPSRKSKQDDGNLKIRYSYTPKHNKSNSRDFCVKMVSLAKSNVVYRKEDIIKMGKGGANSELAPKGKNTYSIWLYKGGAQCHHYWSRRFYMRKKGAKKSNTDKLENDYRTSKRQLAQAKKWTIQPKFTQDGTKFIIKRVSKYNYPVNNYKVAMRPIDMPNRGYTESWISQIGTNIKRGLTKRYRSEKSKAKARAKYRAKKELNNLFGFEEMARNK